MASVAAECPSTLLHFVEPPTACRVKRRRRFDLEFRSPAVKRSAATSASLLHWLKDLPTLQRYQLFSVENPWLSHMLRQMFTKKLQAGEGKFVVISPQRSDSDELEDYFTFSPESSDLTVLNYERELEQHLRFCDTAQYLDTISLSPELLQDFDRCLLLAEQISHKAAFQTPCLVLWDSAAKSWLWQCPPWVMGSAVGLAALALAAFEKNCWARFFEATGRDPRAPGETQGFTWDAFPPDICLAQVDNLKSFWKSLSPSARSSLIGSAADISQLFQLSKHTYQDLQRKKTNECPLLSPCTYNWKVSLTFKEPYYAAIKTRMQRYLSPRSAEYIYKMMDEDGEYVEFLLLSPLERTWSIFDFVARKIADKLKEALTAQIAEDLLKSECSQNTVKKIPNKGKKKKKQKRKEPIQAISAVKDESVEVDITDFAQEIVRNTVDSALSQATQRAQTTEDGFQTVQSGRKRTERCKLTSGVVSSHKTHLPGKTRNWHVISSPKTSTTVVIQWAEAAPEVPAVKFEQEADFPPLSASISPSWSLPSENLSLEMSRFKAEIVNIMICRRKTMLSFLYKMQEIVGFLFPGAHVNIFGSYATRLALPVSDLDLAVVNSGLSRPEIASSVTSLAEVLQVCKWAVHVQSIVTASVPIVKLTVDPHYFGGEWNDYVKVDITIEDQKDVVEGRHIGMASVSWVKELVAEFPLVQEVVLALKNVLYLKGLHSAYLGGLSSYSLVLWVAAYVRSFPCKSSGEALMSLLKFYGDFDIQAKAIGPQTDGSHYSPRPQPTFTLCETWDPVTPGNNTTKGAYRIADVQLLFQHCHGQLQAALSQGVKDPLTRLFLELGAS